MLHTEAQEKQTGEGDPGSSFQGNNSDKKY